VKTVIDAAGQQIDRNLIRAERLRQSVLKKAFSGHLLPSAEAVVK
jgi:hypothetical protein